VSNETVWKRRATSAAEVGDGLDESGSAEDLLERTVHATLGGLLGAAAG
jgi:hypothetical protein